jgi:hypothetical protein
MVKSRYSNTLVQRRTNKEGRRAKRFLIVKEYRNSYNVATGIYIRPKNLLIIELVLAIILSLYTALDLI